MPDTIILPAAFAFDEDRTPASRGFIERRLLSFTSPLSRHQAEVEALRAELAWSTSEWRRLNPNWGGEPGDVEMAAQAERLPHEAAAATALTAWSAVVTFNGCIRESAAKLVAQRKAGSSWAARAERTADDLREHRQRRRVLWRTFLLALRCYRDRRAEIDAPVRAEAA